MSPRCEVCSRGMDLRSRGTVCARCASDGAVFRRRWEGDLLVAGLTHTEACGIVDSRERSPRLIREAAHR